MGIAEVITAISVAIAALSFVTGVSAWKREFVGKRRIELAESVLAMFYEAEDAIRMIRNPSSWGDEGQTRKRSEYEKEEESKLLDQAYVVFERYQKRDTLFAQLRSSKYRFMAAFGSEAGKPFDELNTILNEIFIAARMLGKHFWPRQGRVPMSDEKFQRHLAEMHKHEAVFWFMGEEEDEIGPRVHSIVQKVERITQGAVAENSSLTRGLMRRLRGSGKSTQRALGDKKVPVRLNQR